MSQHPITITGHLTQDPRTIRLRSGQIKTVVRVASSRRVRDVKPANPSEDQPAQSSQNSSPNNGNTESWKDIDLLFMDVEVWGQFGINVRKSLSKGMPVIAVGSLMTNMWADGQGQNQSRTIMRANFLGLDLNRYAVASKKNDSIHNEAGIDEPGFDSSDNDCPIDEDHYGQSANEGNQAAEGTAPEPREDDLPPALRGETERPSFEDRKRSHDARAGLGLGGGAAQVDKSTEKAMV